MASSLGELAGAQGKRGGRELALPSPTLHERGPEEVSVGLGGWLWLVAYTFIWLMSSRVSLLFRMGVDLVPLVGLVQLLSNGFGSADGRTVFIMVFIQLSVRDSDTHGGKRQNEKVARHLSHFCTRQFPHRRIIHAAAAPTVLGIFARDKKGAHRCPGECHGLGRAERETDNSCAAMLLTCTLGIRRCGRARGLVS